VAYPRGQYWVQSCLVSVLMTWTMAQSAHSASLQTVRNQEEWLIHQMGVLLFRVTSQAGDLMIYRNLIEFKKGK